MTPLRGKNASIFFGLADAPEPESVETTHEEPVMNLTIHCIGCGKGMEMTRPAQQFAPPLCADCAHPLKSAGLRNYLDNLHRANAPKLDEVLSRLERIENTLDDQDDSDSNTAMVLIHDGLYVDSLMVDLVEAEGVHVRVVWQNGDETRQRIFVTPNLDTAKTLARQITERVNQGRQPSPFDDFRNYDGTYANAPATTPISFTDIMEGVNLMKSLPKPDYSFPMTAPGFTGTITDARGQKAQYVDGRKEEKQLDRPDDEAIAQLPGRKNPTGVIEGHYRSSPSHIRQTITAKWHDEDGLRVLRGRMLNSSLREKPLIVGQQITAVFEGFSIFMVVEKNEGIVSLLKSNGAPVHFGKEEGHRYRIYRFPVGTTQLPDIALDDLPEVIPAQTFFKSGAQIERRVVDGWTEVKVWHPMFKVVVPGAPIPTFTLIAGAWRLSGGIWPPPSAYEGVGIGIDLAKGNDLSFTRTKCFQCGKTFEGALPCCPECGPDACEPKKTQHETTCRVCQKTVDLQHAMPDGAFMVCQACVVGNIQEGRLTLKNGQSIPVDKTAAWTYSTGPWRAATDEPGHWKEAAASLDSRDFASITGASITSKIKDDEATRRLFEGILPVDRVEMAAMEQEAPPEDETPTTEHDPFGVGEPVRQKETKDAPLMYVEAIKDDGKLRCRWTKASGLVERAAFDKEALEVADDGR